MWAYSFMLGFTKFNIFVTKIFGTNLCITFIMPTFVKCINTERQKLINNIKYIWKIKN